MDSSARGALVFYVRVPRALEEPRDSPQNLAFLLQHQLLANVFPFLSDKKCLPVQKFSFVVDFKDVPSPKGLKIVSPFFKNSLEFKKILDFR